MNNPNESQTRPVELPQFTDWFVPENYGGTRCVSVEHATNAAIAYAERYVAAETKRAELAEGQRDAWQLSCWTARNERDAETKRADALAVRVKELEAERDQHRARADAIESAANEVKFDYYCDLPAEVSKLFDGAKTLTVLNMPTIRKLRSLLKAFDAERGDVKGDCDA